MNDAPNLSVALARIIAAYVPAAPVDATMMLRAFNALPPRLRGEIGAGEMERVLSAALAARPSGTVSAEAVRAEIAIQQQRMREAQAKAATGDAIVSGQAAFLKQKARLIECFILRLTALLPVAQEKRSDG